MLQSPHPFRQQIGLVAVLVCLQFLAKAQGTAADFQRAALVKQAMENKIFFAPRSFNWISDSKCWYLNNTPQGKKFVLLDAAVQKKKPAFNHEMLAKTLSEATGQPCTANSLPFTAFSYLGDTAIQFTAYQGLYTANLRTYRVTRAAGKVHSEALETGLLVSPDGKTAAYIREYNLYIKPVSGEKAVQLSFDGSAGDYYDSAIQWSPDSKKIAVNKVRPGAPHPVYLIKSSPTDQLQPKLHTRNYLKPGDALPQKQPNLFIISSGARYSVNAAAIDTQYNVGAPVWQPDSQSFTFEYNRRGHQTYKVYNVNASTGLLSTLVNERAKTFINVRKLYRYNVSSTNEIIWTSERDGWNHLYLYDGKTGKVKNQVTTGKWAVRNVLHVDEAARTILFEASGYNNTFDPYLLQVFSVQFDGTGLTNFTPENGNHLVTFSPDFTSFIDSYSLINVPPVTVLRSAKSGKVLMPLEKADIEQLATIGWKAPEVFTTTGRDGKTGIWGIIVRPSNFNPAKQYPVIEYIYGGPHNSFVPKSFISDPAPGDYRPWTALHELAELGFIVVQIDGMGTGNRSKAFHDVCWKNLKDGGFPDRIKWINEVAKTYAYIDTSRVGIYGNSAGGQNSVAAMLFHPDFYKVAVSSSGCHDNRMDKIGWNEQWMGYPVGPEYAKSSNVTHAKNLQGKLLLILGELDENVPPEVYSSIGKCADKR